VTEKVNFLDFFITFLTFIVNSIVCTKEGKILVSTNKGIAVVSVDDLRKSTRNVDIQIGDFELIEGNGSEFYSAIDFSRTAVIGYKTNPVQTGEF
jgi:hypothetical protein